MLYTYMIYRQTTNHVLNGKLRENIRKFPLSLIFSSCEFSNWKGPRRLNVFPAKIWTEIKSVSYKINRTQVFCSKNTRINFLVGVLKLHESRAHNSNYQINSTNTSFYPTCVISSGFLLITKIALNARINKSSITY